MSASILHNPSLVFIKNPDITPEIIDLSCFTTALDLSSVADVIQIGTFCEPTASAIGSISEEATAVFLWEPALAEALDDEDMIGEEILVQLAVKVGDTFGVSFRASYASLPWGRFGLGAPVEVDLALAVKSSFKNGDFDTASSI